MVYPIYRKKQKPNDIWSLLGQFKEKTSFVDHASMIGAATALQVAFAIFKQRGSRIEFIKPRENHPYTQIIVLAHEEETHYRLPKCHVAQQNKLGLGTNLTATLRGYLDLMYSADAERRAQHITAIKQSNNQQSRYSPLKP